MRVRNQDEAIEAYASFRGGQIPEGYYVTARCAVDLGFALSDDACLWSVGLASDDEANSITGDTRTYLGPDGKVWTFPANPRFYRREIIEEALTDIHVEGVADLVDPQTLAEKVKLFTPNEDRSIWSLSVAARGGKLRRRMENQ
jgi:hypothetical protein